jgi:hypothetical protein
MPPKPKMPAISAITKNVTTQLNMISILSFCFDISAADEVAHRLLG